MMGRLEDESTKLRLRLTLPVLGLRHHIATVATTQFRCGGSGSYAVRTSSVGHSCGLKSSIMNRDVWEA